MSFENCKQIEINGRVFDCTGYDDLSRSLNIQVHGWLSVQFLEAIGAKPALDMPKKGDVIMVQDSNWGDHWSARVATGRMHNTRIETYRDVSQGEVSFNLWDLWKPFNPEELE
jgi:hypothetical protein